MNTKITMLGLVEALALKEINSQKGLIGEIITKQVFEALWKQYFS